MPQGPCLQQSCCRRRPLQRKSLPFVGLWTTFLVAVSPVVNSRNSVSPKTGPGPYMLARHRLSLDLRPLCSDVLSATYKCICTTVSVATLNGFCSQAALLQLARHSWGVPAWLICLMCTNLRFIHRIIVIMQDAVGHRCADSKEFWRTSRAGHLHWYVRLMSN